MKRIYLDFAATTPVAAEVIAAMQPYFADEFGNASSLHEFGFRARKLVESARRTIAYFLGTPSDDIIFTGSGTEANNMAVQGSVFAAGISPAHIITTVVEHSSVYNTCMFLKSLGHEITVLPVDSRGCINTGALESAIQENTLLISVQYANNEIGSLQPIDSIAEIACRHGILFHTDAVQAIGKISIDMPAQKIDLLSAAAHKFYGPKGAGFLCLNHAAAAGKMRAKNKNKPALDTLLQPLLFGGPQEAGLRPATENVPGIAGLEKAVELVRASMPQEPRRLEDLRDYAIGRLQHEIPGARLNGPRGAERLANNINICLPGVNAYELVLLLDRHGIACSTGAACSSNSEKPSRVLTAIGLSHQDALCSLRISLGRQSTQDEIDFFIGKLPELIATLKEMNGA